MNGALLPRYPKASEDLQGVIACTIATLFLLVGSPLHSFGQSAKLINDGAHIVTTSGATIYTQGEVRNRVNGGNNGTITNDGTILTTHANPNNASYFNLNADAITQGNGTFEIEGDWVNSAVFNGDNGEVLLDGPNQLITGDSVSTFNDLTLTGTGTKTLDLDAEVTGILALTDRRLHTDTNSMFVLNTDPAAITRTPGLSKTVQGFVSSDSTGWLVREMDQTSSYLFPVGDSIGTPRFRPADLTPSSTNPQTFRARLKNSDPTPDGYDVTNKAAGIGPVNPDFYWHIDRTSGSDPMDVQLFYDEAVDTADMAVHWQSQWEMMGAPTNTMNGSPQLSSVSHSGWNTFTPDPFNIAANPLMVDAGNDTTICIGDTAQLNANVTGGTGPFGYTWTPSTYLNDSTLKNPEAQGVMDTITYYVTAYDSATGTTSQPDSMQVIVDPGPNVSISPSNPATCPGDSVQLNASGASSYTWSPDSTLTSNTGSTVYSVPGDTETVVVTGTNAIGCTGTDTVGISVQSAPGEPIASVTPDTICQGDSATITATGSGPGVTYNVYDSANAGTLIGSTPLTVGPMSDTSYYIQATLTGSGCKYPGPRDTVDITVQPAPAAPTVTIAPDTICFGDTTTISATGSGAGVTYKVYDDSTGGTYLGDASLDLHPDSTQTYYVEAVASNGCAPVGGRVPDTVHVDTLPDVGISPATPVLCKGDTAELAASGADSSYTWVPNVDISSTTGDTVQVWPDSDTTYTVTGTDSTGCMNDTSVTVSVDSAPKQPNVSIVPDTICQGDSAVISASGSGAGVVYEVYDSAMGGNYIGNTPLTVAPMKDSTYYVEATLSGGGCSFAGGRVADSLTVNSATPAPTVTVTPDTVCPGDTAMIDASGSGAGVTYEVYDSASGGNYLGNAPLNVSTDSTTNYFVAAVGANGCDQLGGRDTATVHAYPEPVANAGPDQNICPGDTTVLTASGGTSYTWSTGTLDDSTEVSPDSTSAYWVDVQDANGCTDRDSVTVNVIQPSSFIALDDEGTVEAKKSITIDVFANDTGAVGDSAIISGPFQGSASWSSGGIEYNASDSEGEDSLNYEVCNLTCSTICDTATVNITIEEGVEDLFIPNGVSADGDGRNDVWEISGLEAYPENSVKIFNRWGDQVYSADPYKNDWNGQGKNGKVLEGTYFYVLDLGPEEGKKTGFIELRR